MPNTMANFIESVLNILNNLLGGLVDLGSSQPLTPMGSELVKGVANDAVSLAWFLARIAVENPIS